MLSRASLQVFFWQLYYEGILFFLSSFLYLLHGSVAKTNCQCKEVLLGMNNLEAKKRIEKLRQEISGHAHAYYVLDAPSVSDAVYDSLVKEYKAICKEFPELADPNFIVERVGGVALEQFIKAKHAIRMLSLNDAFSREEVTSWENRVSKLLGYKPSEYFCELKMDGLAVSIIYQNGKLVRAVTRGDGSVGEDITQNIKTVRSVPVELASSTAPDYLEVRGEVVMLKKTLERLNKKYLKQGKPLLANTRNAAAGSLRQLDPKLAAERNLDFFAWDVAQIRITNPSYAKATAGKQESRITNPEKHSEEHGLLRKLGFQVADAESVARNLDEVFQFIAVVSEKREKYPFGTDGVVVQVNNLKDHEVLGVVGKAPRYAIAYKYPAEQATTQVIDIFVQVGRTGVLTPVAHFNPTLVAGSQVSKATLHNIDQIERLGLKIGDTVVIQKAGDVIPEVVEVLTKLRSGKEKKFVMASRCPVCGGKVEKRVASSKKDSTSVAYFCINLKCPAKNSRGMQHFVNIFEIYEVGPKVLDRFQEEGLISDAADLFTLKKEDIQGLDRFGEKSAENIIKSVQDHKKQSLAKFIYALGIIHVGEQTAEDLAKQFQNLDKLKLATEEEINAVENIGPVVSKSVYDYFHTKENLKYIQKLLDNGVAIESYKLATSNLKLFGKTFVITGTLETMSRDEAKKKVKAQGGKVSESVSKLTDYVVVGSDPGSKAEKAEEFGIKILDEHSFLKMVK